jgi:Response regulators consisting of a CheY-like receiver domain and a winged-helix DNA-binding domain
MKNILIIEDDEAIAEIQRDFLDINGYSATIVADGVQGLHTALEGSFDLILLDVMLPSMDGFEICKRLRASLDIPILMVTARTEDMDKIRGLGFGADDYISKPFSPTELVARVRSNIAQYERMLSKSQPVRKQSELCAGRIRLNPQTRCVYVDDREIDCKNREYELLYFLMSNPEIVFSKERLYERIWGMEAFGDLKTVAVHINRIRDKIEEDPSNPRHILTVWGAGYRFRSQ